MGKYNILKRSGEKWRKNMKKYERKDWNQFQIGIVNTKIKQLKKIKRPSGALWIEITKRPDEDPWLGVEYDQEEKHSLSFTLGKSGHYNYNILEYTHAIAALDLLKLYNPTKKEIEENIDEAFKDELAKLVMKIMLVAEKDWEDYGESKRPSNRI